MKKRIESIVVGVIETNCWLYLLDEAEGSCAVIDPGDEGEAIISRLKELAWVPRYIFLTHGHFDHLMALPDLLKAWGKGDLPRIGIHRLDAHYLGKDALSAHRDSFSAAGGNPAFVDSIWNPLPNADVLLEEGDTAGPFRVLHLPGHTSGSAGFYDEKAGILFTGDTLFRGAQGQPAYGRTDLPGGDSGQMDQSLKRLLSMEKEITIYPGHGPASTIGEESARSWANP